MPQTKAPDAERCDPPHQAQRLPRIEGSPEALERASRLFRALGDEARLRLLARLAEGPACVTDLAEAEGESLPTVSQRIKVLRSEHLVTRTRSGRHITYALVDDHVVAIVRAAIDHAAEPGRR
jgi:ArsR family transcriptional regulator